MYTLIVLCLLSAVQSLPAPQFATPPNSPLDIPSIPKISPSDLKSYPSNPFALTFADPNPPTSPSPFSNYTLVFTAKSARYGSSYVKDKLVSLLDSAVADIEPFILPPPNRTPGPSSIDLIDPTAKQGDTPLSKNPWLACELYDKEAPRPDSWTAQAAVAFLRTWQNVTRYDGVGEFNFLVAEQDKPIVRCTQGLNETSGAGGELEVALKYDLPIPVRNFVNLN